MKKLRFVYEMQLEFDAPINNHYYYLHCRPRNDGTQRLYGYTLELTGDELTMQTDMLGNEYYSGRFMASQDKFGFRCTGMVFTGIGSESPDCNRLYCYNTSVTACGAELTAFGAAQRLKGATPLEQAEIFMQAIYQELSYVAGATDIETAAEAAFRQRSGVCQDYAHIMLALCRSNRIPARYIAGLMQGEGASHAWLEIYDGTGWIGLDPTHNCRINDNYIKLAEGRDYRDCLINKGIFRGSASQRQKIYANVEEIL